MKNFLMTAALASMVLTACSSAPKPNMSLETARQTYATVANDPVVVKNAPLELEEAKRALQRSEELWAGKAKEVDVTHTAYLATQQSKIAQQTARIKTAEESIKTAEAERNRALLAARTAQASEAQNRARMLEEQVRESDQRLQTLQQQLAEAQNRRDMVLTLGSDIMFDTGKSTLKPGADSSISQVAEFLKQYPDRSVVVVGHTDNVGNAEYNQTLSLNRAESVKAALIRNGVAPNQVETQGRGLTAPIASNDTAAGRQQNRRVELVISNPSAAN